MKSILFWALMLFPVSAFSQDIKGGWMLQGPEGERATIIINEDYLVLASYDVNKKEFGYTEGGSYTMRDKVLSYDCEFNSDNADLVGQKSAWQVSTSGSSLTLSGDRGTFKFDRIDKASDNAMAGTWAITERAQEGKGELVKIHQTGTRKTLKILSGTRFQWVAIDPGAKGFYGTGGGTYTTKDGKYTEVIEFFSRDNSRVGASLEFGWKLQNGRWDHSGKSSKGDPIQETWEKVKALR